MQSVVTLQSVTGKRRRLASLDRVLMANHLDRMLFLLHESVLDALQNPQCEADYQQRDVSHIGLDMVC